MMKTSDRGRKFIESFEGLILQAYDDYNDRILRRGEKPRGVLTIGYGHTRAAGPPNVYVGMEISKEQADEIASSDLHSVENEVLHLVKVPLRQNQFDALVSFHFNTGALAHPNNSVLSFLNRGDYATAARKMMLYNHAGGRVVEGLTRRRTAEVAMFMETPK